MTDSLREFLRSGRIAGVQFGLTRNDVVEVLGAPVDWLGKWPNPEDRPSDFWPLHPEVKDPMDAELWFYYDSSLGVRFDLESLVEQLIVYPKDTAFPPDAFGNWPELKSWTIGEFVGWLRAREIPFVIPRPEEGIFKVGLLSATDAWCYALLPNGLKLEPSAISKATSIGRSKC